MPSHAAAHPAAHAGKTHRSVADGHRSRQAGKVHHVESLDPSAENALQREKRISFYSRNGIFDTGCRFIDEGETYSVLASDIDHFDSREYETLLRSFSFGTYKKHIAR